MSKPNLLAFSTSVGYFRNKKIREARRALLQKWKRAVPLADLTPQFFGVLMAYAGENQIDGDFGNYSTEEFQEIFANNNVALSVPETKAVIEIFHAVRLMEDGKIRSWKKFNRHLANYEQDKKAKIKAGKERAKQRAAASNGHDPDAAPVRDKGQPARDKLEWGGKLWPPTALQDLCKKVEKQIAAKKKDKPDSDAGADSHNIWLTQLNALEQKLASIESALTGEQIPPRLTSAPKRLSTTAAAPIPSDEEQERGREKAAQRLGELAKSI